MHTKKTSLLIFPSMHPLSCSAVKSYRMNVPKSRSHRINTKHSLHWLTKQHTPQWLCIHSVFTWLMNQVPRFTFIRLGWGPDYWHPHHHHWLLSYHKNLCYSWKALGACSRIANGASLCESEPGMQRWLIPKCCFDLIGMYSADGLPSLSATDQTPKCLHVMCTSININTGSRESPWVS